MELTELLEYAHNNDASDIHISTNHPPIFRINGDMVALRVPPIDSETVKNILVSIMSEKQRAEYEEFLEIDFAISFGENRFRVNAFNTLSGPAAVLRKIPTRLKTLKELNAPDVIESLATLNKGLILITGPTGSGKSTTVAAMIDYINKHFYKHVLTIEDPIEFIHKSEKCLINHREIGVHSISFARALKSSLREDPDVIVVGELRDIETIHLAITAAETGHLVIGTLHTSSAAKTVDRIIDVFPPEDKDMIRTMLSTTLEGVISQRLLKKKDGSGRVAAYEVLVATSGVRNLIREGKTPQISSLMEIGTKSGMLVLRDSIFELVKSGTVTNDAARHALNVAEHQEITKKDSNIQGGF